MRKKAEKSSSKMKKLRSTAVKHLRGDIKGYREEIKEDKILISQLKGKKVGKKKNKK